MIHHYQEEFNNFIEKSAELFGLDKTSIYTQFIVMLGTISFLNFGESTKLFIIPALENYPWIHTAAFIFGVTAKFFTTCVGAIATFKFVSEISNKITNWFKNRNNVNNSTNNK